MRTRGVVMLVVTSLDHGGADAQVVDIAIELRLRGWDVVVVSLLAPRAHLDRLAAAGVPTASLGMTAGIPDPRGGWRLLRLIRRNRVDILHGHMYHANLLTRITAPFGSVPAVVSTIHSIREGGRGRELMYRATDRLADVTAAVSHAAGEYYCGAGAVRRKRLRIVPNGVDVERFAPPAGGRATPGSAFRWVTVSRLDPAKDLPTLLRAMRLLAQRSGEYSTTLRIAGDGPLRPALEALSGELRLGGVVSFLGFRDDVADLLRSADGFVLSSEIEGLPMALLEASACELPIVATDVGGNREIVVHGQTGYLASPGDPAALSCAMERLIVGRHRELGRAGRVRTASQYSLSAAVDRWESLYRDLLTLD